MKEIKEIEKKTVGENCGKNQKNKKIKIG